MTRPATTVLVSVRGGSGLREIARVCARATGVSVFVDVGPCGQGDRLTRTLDADRVRRFTARANDAASLNGVYELWRHHSNITLVRPAAAQGFFHWLRESGSGWLLAAELFHARAGVVTPAVTPCLRHAEQHARALQRLLAPHHPPIIVVNDPMNTSAAAGLRPLDHINNASGSAFRIVHVPCCPSPYVSRWIARGESVTEAVRRRAMQDRSRPPDAPYTDPASLQWLQTTIDRLRFIMPGELKEEIMPAESRRAAERLSRQARAAHQETQWNRLMGLLGDRDTWRGALLNLRRVLRLNNLG